MKAKISCMFQDGMAIKDYDIKEYEVVTIDNNGISYINLDAE